MFKWTTCAKLPSATDLAVLSSCDESAVLKPLRKRDKNDDRICRSD